MSIIFILSKLLKLIPEPTLPSIEVPGISNMIQENNDNNVSFIIKVRACILLVFFIFILTNLISHCVKINLFNKEIEKNKKDPEKIQNLKNKRNICIFGLVFCFSYCFLILADFLVSLLKITDIIQNQHFYNSLLTGSIIYALLPLAYLFVSITREITKCIFYKEIAEDKNSIPEKIYSSLANVEYITSIFCFFWDIINWNEIKSHQSHQYFNQNDRIVCKEVPDTDGHVKNYKFTLFYFMPVEVTKNGDKNQAYL
jgi:hypothetical protein